MTCKTKTPEYRTLQHKSPYIDRVIFRIWFSFSWKTLSLPINIARLQYNKNFTGPSISLSLDIHKDTLTRRQSTRRSSSSSSSGFIALCLYEERDTLYKLATFPVCFMILREHILVSANWKLATAADGHMCVFELLLLLNSTRHFYFAKKFRKLFSQWAFFFYLQYISRAVSGIICVSGFNQFEELRNVFAAVA